MQVIQNERLPSSEPGGCISLFERVVPYFQPIFGTSLGQIVGFEALARLKEGDRLLAPSEFADLLSGPGSLELFSVMLTKSLLVLGRLSAVSNGAYVSVNLGASLLLHPNLLDLLRFVTSDHDLAATPLVIEILEGEAFLDTASMLSVIEDIKRLGIAVALDDVGSAYASLLQIKDLPVDIVKLDQSFSRTLESRPEDLQFITSMLALARGLGRKLVVEGVETANILEALTIIGVDHVQGYAISRPMPEEAIAGWLRTSLPGKRDCQPQSMFGVYAAHLNIVEACRVLANQPLRMSWHADAFDPHRCAIGKFFDRHGLHDTVYGFAHKRFHRSLACDDCSDAGWRSTAEELRLSLLTELMRDGKKAYCCSSEG